MDSLTPPPPNRAWLRRAWWQLVRTGFHLLYNELAFTYDVVSWLASLGQWRAWQRVALRYLEAPCGASVLELAHGTGTLALELRRAGYRLVALDASPMMGRLARRRLLRWGWQPPLVRSHAQRLPFPAETFDAVVSTFPTDFIIHPDTLNEVRRVLRPDGQLVVVYGGLLTGKTPADSALELAYRATGQRGPWPVDLETRLSQAGFTARLLAEPLARSVVLLFVARPT